jgi:glutathionyl-hydroquinone reductase
MVMGISSAAEIFQREIEKLLDGLKGAMNLSDYIYVWGDSYVNHDILLYLVLDELQNEGVGLNSEKCEIRKTELYLFITIYIRNRRQFKRLY